jgi:hypothetical protein
MACPACGDTGWVCEAHADRPWGDHANACQCGDAGMPCEACNPCGGIDEPPAKSPIARVTIDRDKGPRSLMARSDWSRPLAAAAPKALVRKTNPGRSPDGGLHVPHRPRRLRIGCASIGRITTA